MLVSKILSTMRLPKPCLSLASKSIRAASKKSSNEARQQNKANANLSLGDMGTKYRVYRDEDSVEILDIFEESHKFNILDADEEDERVDPLAGINLERGVSGVYEIEDLVDVLRRENAENIFVALVPKEMKYVDYICVTTGKSYKHMLGIAQFIKKVYKRKMDRSLDLFPKIEGEESKDWMAIDLGNIALHIFSRNARQVYDLDSLWALGPQYDREYNKQDPVSEMLEQHSHYLQDLHPAC